MQSGADNVYDTAAWNAIAAGLGWIRVTTDWASNDSFDKEIKLLRVPEFSSCMLDPNSTELDGSDAEYGFAYTDIEKEAFERLYPDVEVGSIESGEHWCTPDSIRIVEYYHKSYDTKEIALTDQGVMSVEDAKDQGLEIVQTRTVKEPKVKWCKLVKSQILEESDWEGQYIPIVPVYGEEVWIDGKRNLYALHEQAQDPQRRFNFWLSAGTEVIAIQPRAPYIGVTGQFDTHGDKWAEANNQNFAFLEYDPVRLPDGTYAAAPQRQSPPMASTAMFQEMLAAADGIKASMGIFDASLGARGNETSGKAIIARQREGDNATFHFVDNLQTSIRHVGRILIDLIPKIYNSKRIVRIIGEDDSQLNVALNQPAFKTPEGDFIPSDGSRAPDAVFDVNAGKYDVIAVVGASYATKRQETADTLQAIMQAAPETFSIFGDILLRNLDIAESDVMAERLKKANPIMRDEENPQEAQLQQAGQMIQAMQAQLQQMEAALGAKREKDTAEIQSEIAKTQAEIEKIQAETIKIQTEVAAAAAQVGQLSPEQLNEIVMTIAALEQGMNEQADTVNGIMAAIANNQATSQPVPMGMPTDQGMPNV